MTMLVLTPLEAATTKRDYAAAADPTTERIRFASGLLPETLRWTNRPTFQ